ncbi:MAG: hypothetical protein ACTS5A_03865 [Candidatus Hodgkinia cicadicola]
MYWTTCKPGANRTGKQNEILPSEGRGKLQLATRLMTAIPWMQLTGTE